MRAFEGVTGCAGVVEGANRKGVRDGVVARVAVAGREFDRELTSVRIGMTVLATVRRSHELPSRVLIGRLMARVAGGRAVASGERIETGVSLLPELRGMELLPIVAVEAAVVLRFELSLVDILVAPLTCILTPQVAWSVGIGVALVE